MKKLDLKKFSYHPENLEAVKYEIVSKNKIKVFFDMSLKDVPICCGIKMLFKDENTKLKILNSDFNLVFELKDRSNRIIKAFNSSKLIDEIQITEDIFKMNVISFVNKNENKKGYIELEIIEGDCCF